MAVGGMVIDKGRLAMFSLMRGHIPPAVHEYSLFKLPGQTDLTIEDPRVGVFEDKVKFQSRFNDEICCFASASLFYAAFHIFKLRPTYRDTSQLLDHIYSNRHLQNLMTSLESKVGRSIETKEQVIEDFIKSLQDIVHDTEKLSPVFHEKKPDESSDISISDANKGL